MPNSNPAFTRMARGPAPPPRTPTSRVTGQNEYDAVPMEYRAQVLNRCQRQFVTARPRDADETWRSPIQKWHDEWIKGVNREVFKGRQRSEHEEPNLIVITIEIDWRLITNSGIDEGFIRPVIDSHGWPLIPGSSIKGLFRREWNRQKLDQATLRKLCGSSAGSSKLQAGALRFHGAFCLNHDWMNGSLDLTHPQQAWQVGFNSNQDENKPKAIAVVSLWKPKLTIAISCKPNSINQDESAKVKDVLHACLGAGIGGRTAAGYGRLKGKTCFSELFSCEILGQGIAPKLLDIHTTAEFRPVSFRASIRCMALRLFAGLLPTEQALAEVDYLFGSLKGSDGPTVGILLSHFENSEPIEVGTPAVPDGHQRWEFRPPKVMRVQGRLIWETRHQTFTHEQTNVLGDFLAALHGLVMSLGGFGKSWRRVDHRIFPLRNKYYSKTPLGCHWEWINIPAPNQWLNVQSIEDLQMLISKARSLARVWLTQRNISMPQDVHPSWREVIHPHKMTIWARVARSPNDCAAINWFHTDRILSSIQGLEECRFKGTSLVGQSRPPARVGQVWHRMLPIQDDSHGYRTVGYEGRQGQFITADVWNGPFLEILTFFPISPNQRDEQRLVRLLDQGAGVGFHRLRWSDP